MHIFNNSKRKLKLPAIGLTVAVILLCAVLIIAGAFIPAIVIALLCVILALAGNFLFDFTLNPGGRFTIANMFRRGRVNGAEDKTDLHVSDAALTWRYYRAGALEWFNDRGQEVFVTGREGLRLQGYAISQEGHRYAILCHGYAGKPADLAGSAKKFFDMGFSVVTPVSRGYGRSEGGCCGMGWLERLDVIDWIDAVVDGDPDAELLLFGVSMGGATVMMASGETLPGNVKCIIEDCGYSSVWEEFSLQIRKIFHVPAFPLLNIADIVCRIRGGYSFKEASAVNQLKKAAVPMLFIHGEADIFVPYSMLNTVYEACASAEKERLSVPGGTHAQSVNTDPKLYWDTVTAFSAKYFKGLT